MKRATVTVTKARPRMFAATYALFKTDHPRAIDRYIDYFGGRGPRTRFDDACGDEPPGALEHLRVGGCHVPLAG
jgi:hypothetical protein